MLIGVVIVTYNRLEKLKIALDSFDKQTKKPAYILVINNKSTDNTSEFLKNWQKDEREYRKYDIEMKENLGGSGGFYEGLKESLNLNADWIWVSDDDAFPEKDVIEKAENFLEHYKNKNELAAICTKVCNNGRIDYWHRYKVKKGILKLHTVLSDEEDYKKEKFDINQFSYVGTIMNKEYLKKYGITNKEYFIHYDDSEHSYRLSKYGKILCVPSMTVHHDTDESKNEADWKVYYHIRNRLHYYKSIGKRFFWFEYLKTKISLVVKRILKYNIYKHKLLEDAINDAKNDKLGKNEIYIPGWNFKK